MYLVIRSAELTTIVLQLKALTLPKKTLNNLLKGGIYMGYKNASERNKRLKSRYKRLGNKMTSGVWYDENNERYREYHAEHCKRLCQVM